MPLFTASGGGRMLPANTAYGEPVAVTLPGATAPNGKLSRLYRLNVPTGPNGVPSGRCFERGSSMMRPWLAGIIPVQTVSK